MRTDVLDLVFPRAYVDVARIRNPIYLNIMRTDVLDLVSPRTYVDAAGIRNPIPPGDKSYLRHGRH